MNMKHLMMNGKVWIGAFTVFAVLVIVFAIIIPMMRENSVLGHGNPTKQKLMVIDQDTGAISFVTKSLQGINDDFTSEQDRDLNVLKMLTGKDMNNYGVGPPTSGAKTGAAGSVNGVIHWLDARITAIDGQLKKILGDDLKGDSSGLKAVDKNRVKHSGNNGILANTIKRIEQIEVAVEAKIATKVGNGARINMLSGGPNRNEFRLGDENCNNRGEADPVRWCRTSSDTQMDIRLWCVGNCKGG